MKGWKVVSYSVQCINLEEGEYVKKKTLQEMLHTIREIIAIACSKEMNVSQNRLCFYQSARIEIHPIKCRCLLRCYMHE